MSEHQTVKEPDIQASETAEMRASGTMPATPRATKKPSRRTLTILFLVGIVILAGLFSVLTLWPSPTPAPVAGVPIGAVAPEFVLPISGGGGHGSINLRALRGPPTVINFWSESCPPCVAEAPLLEHLYRKYGAQGATFELLGINQADPQGDIAPFGRQFHDTYPLLFDPGGRVNQLYKVTALPVTYFLDKNGVVRTVFVTELTATMFRQGLASVGVRMP
jgi:cytochrome c biogenesis protein CcmG, thiol:disulfide interchange protein DsbE